MNIEELKKQIVAANKSYRDGHPTMDDQSFDDLCEELEKLLPKDDYSSFRDSLNEGRGKIKHPFIMGSLDKLKRENPKEVFDFMSTISSVDINVSAKVDGISSRASYKNGRLSSLSTRGDGSFGENITDKANHIKSLPSDLRDALTNKLIDEDLEIRGELVILKDDFAKLNDEYDGKFANPRNACAGIINRKDWLDHEVSYVSFIPYTILGRKYTKQEQFKILNSIKGMTPAWYVNTNKFSINNDLIKNLSDWASQDFAYEVDGLVICGVDYKNEEKYRPDKCKAFKMNQMVATTRLVDVSWEGPSKDGVFVGVGIVDPVELGGATISRVTLHNLDIIENLGLMYGSKIEILKSGDIIPHIERVVENDASCRKIDPPDICTCCGSKLVRDGVNMRCMNKTCPDQVIHRLVNFIKKLGVKSASNATLKNFGITSFEKLMSFVPNKNYKSEVKLYDELYAKVFSQSKEKLLGAMNFVGLSETSIGKIVNHYGYDLVESSHFKDEAYKSLPNGIGTITLDKFIEDLPEALAYVNMVINDSRWHYTGDDSDASGNKIDIKGYICVTGSLKFGSRNKFLEFAKEHGYESKAGVSKGLTYLINNDIHSNSSKNRKAKELGIKILSEDDFMKLIQDDSLEYSLNDL